MPDSDTMPVITDVRVRPVEGPGRLRAWVTVTFNDAFVVKAIRIIQGHSRLFVAMPSRQQRDGSHQDLIHPITAEFREYLEQAILTVYDALTGMVAERSEGRREVDVAAVLARVPRPAPAPQGNYVRPAPRQGFDEEPRGRSDRAGTEPDSGYQR
jgi:stage V sporulation protein G